MSTHNIVKNVYCNLVPIPIKIQILSNKICGDRSLTGGDFKVALWVENKQLPPNVELS